MKHTEMMARIESIASTRRDMAYRMILEGYGGSGLAFETGLTRKQINALYAWHAINRKIYPHIAKSGE